MPTIEDDEVLLSHLNTNLLVAKNSADYLMKRLQEVIERRKKGMKGDIEADEQLRTNCREANRKLQEIERLYEQAQHNAGLPGDRRK
jgi:hypothetical protein